MIKQNIRSISIKTPTKIIAISCLRHYKQKTKTSTFSGYFEKTWTKNDAGVYWTDPTVGLMPTDIFYELTEEYSKVIQEIVCEHE